MTNKRIWLQSNEEHNEPTWCEDKINDDDVEYVRADTNAKLLCALEKIADYDNKFVGGYTARDAFDMKAIATRAIQEARGKRDAR